jgi:phospholipid transport system transporter-binding protein
MSAAGFQIDESSVADTVKVSGALVFATAAAALTAIRGALARPGKQRLDLAGVQSSDSAGLACVLAALAGSTQHVVVSQVPAGMLALAQVCEVDGLLAV